MSRVKHTKFFTTWGPVRRSCVHKHRSPRAALTCLQGDQSWCESRGGYSDREIYRVAIADDGTRDQQIVQVLAPGRGEMAIADYSDVDVYVVRQ